MPSPSPALPLVRAKIRSYCAVWMPVFHVFSPLMTHSSPSRTRVRLHVRGVGAVLGLGDAEREAAPAVRRGRRPTPPSAPRCRSAIISSSADVVADDRVLVLQVAVQAEALARQVLADHRHAEVGAVLAAVLLRERVAVVAGRVGPPARLARAAPPTRRSAGRRGPSRCGRPPAGGRRSGCCRPPARAA